MSRSTLSSLKFWWNVWLNILFEHFDLTYWLNMLIGRLIEHYFKLYYMQWKLLDVLIEHLVEHFGWTFLFEHFDWMFFSSVRVDVARRPSFSASSESKDFSQERSTFSEGNRDQGNQVRFGIFTNLILNLICVSFDKDFRQS